MFGVFHAEMRYCVILTVSLGRAYLSPLPAAMLVGHRHFAVCLPSDGCSRCPDCQTRESIRCECAAAAWGAELW